MKIKLLFGGDIAFSYANEVVEDALNEFKPYFENADFSMVNQENIFSIKNTYEPITKSGPNLISSTEYEKCLRAINPTVLGFANNHAGDYGGDALLDTLEFLREKNYTCIGAGENTTSAYKTARFEKSGCKISVVAVCENEFGIASDERAGAAGYNLSKLTEVIKNEINNGYQIFIYFHGGNEYNPIPSPEKCELYRHFIDIGASGVIAMHTHCPQGYEIYKNCPIVYSMGNLYFYMDTLKLETWNYGYLTELELDENGSIDLNIIPYHRDGPVLHILKNDEYVRFMAYLKDLSLPISDKEKIMRFFDGWCLIGGLSYIRSVKFDENMLTDAKSITKVKNIFSCEAHNELIKSYLNLYYNCAFDAQRLNEAKAAAEELRQLQNYK